MKSTIDPEKLLLKVNSGEELTAETLGEVGSLLSQALSDDLGRKPSVDDVYALLLVVGRSDAREQLPLLERFLEEKDPFVVSLVLEILCLQWRIVSQYVERVIHFALGVSWDTDDDVRQTALKILGEYLNAARTAKDKSLKVALEGEVIHLLLATFEDSELEPWTRHQAYYAICRSGGKEWSEIPSECRVLDLKKASSDIDWNLINELSKKVDYPLAV